MLILSVCCSVHQVKLFCHFFHCFPASFWGFICGLYFDFVVIPLKIFDLSPILAGYNRLRSEARPCLLLSCRLKLFARKSSCPAVLSDTFVCDFLAFPLGCFLFGVQLLQMKSFEVALKEKKRGKKEWCLGIVCMHFNTLLQTKCRDSFLKLYLYSAYFTCNAVIT